MPSMQQTTCLPAAPRRPKTGLVLAVAAALVIACLMPYLQDLLVACATTQLPYPGPDLFMDYSLGILWAAVLGTSIFFWPVATRERDALLRIWILKALVALVLMLAYEFRYGFDPDGYFCNAVTPDFVWNKVDFSNGTLFLHDLTWLHLHLVPGSYHGAKVGWAMIGMVAIFLFYRAAVLFLRRDDIRVLYFLALFPSILFWSATLGKDPIVLFGFSFYVYGVVAFQRYRCVRYLLMAACGVLLCAVIRIWVVVITVLPLAVFIFAGRLSLLWRMLLLGLGGSSLAVAVTMLQERFRISSLESVFETRTYAAGAFAGGGSSYKPPEINGVADLCIGLPQAIFSGLFRPLPWDIPNLFGFAEGLCNLALLVLVFLSLKRTRLHELKDPLLWWAILLILCWASVYGLVTYNLGSLVRYKLQILPVLLAVLLYLSRRRGVSAIAQAQGRR